MPMRSAKPSQRYQEPENGQQRYVLGVFAVGGVGEGAFVLATLASLAGRHGSEGYLEAAAVAISSIVAALALGHACMHRTRSFLPVRTSSMASLVSAIRRAVDQLPANHTL